MEYLTLQNIWDNAYINCPIWWEHNQEEVSECGEYDGTSPRMMGANRVYSIRAEYIPEVGNVIMCEI